MEKTPPLKPHPPNLFLMLCLCLCFHCFVELEFFFWGEQSVESARAGVGVEEQDIEPLYVAVEPDR